MRTVLFIVVTALLLYCNIQYINAQCGNNILQPGEQCDNTTVGSCCLSNCTSARNVTPFNPSVSEATYTMTTGYGYTIDVSDIGLLNTGANYPIEWMFNLLDGIYQRNFTHTNLITFTITNLGNGVATLSWNKSWMGVYVVEFETVYCFNPNLSLMFTRELVMNPASSPCACRPDDQTSFCASTPTTNSETRCDCSVQQCFRRDTTTAGSCANRCRIGYDTCPAACVDILQPKPVSFTIPAYDCTSSSTGCTGLSALSCNCPAICGDNILDTSEQCDLGPLNATSPCCTNNCQLTPENTSPATQSNTLVSCATSITLDTLNLRTTNANYNTVYELVNSSTVVPGLTVSLLAATSIEFNRAFEGTVVLVFRSVFCAARNEVFYFTRTITGVPCCGNAFVETGEFCDVGVTNGNAGSCCTTNCQPFNAVSGSFNQFPCIAPKLLYTMSELGFPNLNVNQASIAIDRVATWYQGVGETTRSFYTDRTTETMFSNGTTYFRVSAPLVGGLNVTFSFNYCTGNVLRFWTLIWIPICHCDYCGGTITGPRCSPATNELTATNNPSFLCDCSKVTCYQTYSSLTDSGCTNNCASTGYNTCDVLTGACRDVISPKPVSFSIQSRQVSSTTGLTCSSTACANSNNNVANWINCTCEPICGDGIIDTNEECDNLVSGGCCLNDCRNATALTASHTVSANEIYTVPAVYNNLRGVGTIGIFNAANFPLEIEIVSAEPVNYTHSNNVGFTTDVTSAGNWRVRWNATWVGTYKVNFRVVYCEAQGLMFNYTRYLIMAPPPDPCACYTETTSTMCAFSPTGPSQTKCDCSINQCYRRNTAATGTACTNDHCDVGYNTCTPACSDILVPKPVQFRLINYDCPNTTDTCASLTNVTCNCAAVCGDGIHDTPEFCDAGASNGQAGGCCTTNCSAPVSTTLATLSYNYPTCAAGSVTFATLQLTTNTGGNYPESWSFHNFSAPAGLTVTGAASSISISTGFTGPITVWFRSLFCNVTQEYIYVTRTLVGSCCNNSVINPGEQCDSGPSVNGIATSCCSSLCQFKTTENVCRIQNGLCDAVDFCSGTSATCPADAFLNNTVQCRASSDLCDAPEFCTGSSRNCPVDLLYTNTQICRNSSGICDLIEYCTGASAVCPADFRVAAGTVCRASLDICDAVETCDGIDALCPVDQYLNSSVLCRSSAGICDQPEFCTGSGISCPANIFNSSAQECRPVAGDCDVPEFCTGVDALCPVDALRPNGFICRIVADTCDVQETCSGTDAQCPVDGFASSSVECRASQGVCDPPESCTGTEPTCPVDILFGSSVECRPPAGVCDRPETCSGSSPSCPADIFFNSSTVCRNVSGSCDIEERCSGSSISCPPDTLRSSSFVCATSNSSCTVNVTCTGLSDTCPSNLRAPNSPCTVDGNLCFFDTCAANGTCIRGPPITYDDGLFCNGLETCNTSSGLAIPGTPPNCSDANSCTTDTCSNSLSSCVNTPAPGTTGACGGGLGACTPGTRVCNGTGPTPVVTCVGAVAPVTELCFDSIDNDCDGQVDEFCNGQFCNTVDDCANITLSFCETVTCQNNLCNITQLSVGSQCNDRLACTRLDQCNSLGICAGVDVVCDDNNPCTFDYCTEPFGSCVFDGSVFVGAPCPTGTCNNQGQCVPVHVVCPVLDADECSRYVFNATTGICDLVQRVGSCEDGNACTLYDTCVDGVCIGQEKDCNDFIDCTVDSCIAPSGLCSHSVEDNKCFIDGKCWNHGDVNSECNCLTCQANVSTRDWSFATSALSCNDNNLCTTNDFCDVSTEQCTGTLIDCSQYDSQCSVGICADGICVRDTFDDSTLCNDNDICTEFDVCVGGECKGSPVSCSNLTTECTVYTCSNSSGGCIGEAVENYTKCNIGASVCLGEFYCLAGECTSSGPVVCPTSSNECTTLSCDAQEGCVESPLVGQNCDDGNLCTVGDNCNFNGECVPGDIWINCDDQNDCTDDFCLPSVGCVHIPIANCLMCNATADCSQQTCQQVNCVNGRCRYIASPAGFSCADSNVCNGQEVCTGNGVCVSLGPMICNDNNLCTEDECTPSGGCVFTPLPFTACDDGNACTSNDECNIDGVCTGDLISCPDDTACMDYSCVDMDGNATCVGTPINVNSYCSSGNSCLHNGVCSLHGVCIEEEQGCPSERRCVDSYSCSNGECLPNYSSVGTPCNVEDLCTTSQCDGSGNCIPDIQLINCVSSDPCHESSVCLPATGECFPILKHDGVSCDDGDACTYEDVCTAGVCSGTSRNMCISPNACHAQGVCDPLTGDCLYMPLANYTPCNSNNLCTSSSYCLNGVCVVGDSLICPPSDNPCLISRCDPNQGCLYDFASGPCDDHNLCTDDDTCVSGQCIGMSTVECANNDACGINYCLPQVGCLTPLSDDCQVCTTERDCPVIPCKSASCSVNNTCVYSANDNVLSGCDDNQFCNGVEYCSEGTCIHRPPPMCDDNNDCTIDSCDYDRQQCRHTPTGNVTCSNNDLCAVLARCDGMGHCLTTHTIDCEDSSSCRESRGCNPRTGVCEYTIADDGEECLIDNKCAALSLCRHGICNIIEETKCDQAGTCDTSTTCDTATGHCIAPTTCNRKFCSDGIDCTLGDYCQGETCRSGQFTPCSYFSFDEQCQRVVCTEETGCVVENLADATVCDTGAARGPCSGDDVCLHGSCVRRYNAGLLCREAAPGGCDVPEFCIDGQDYCPDNLFAQDNSTCPDSLFCYSSTCRHGRCLPSIPRDCSLLDTTCTIGVCHEESQSCVAHNLPQNTPCVSGREGQCVPFSRCQSGACVEYYANELTPCDDGSLCTVDDHCSGYNGNCISGRGISCASLDSACGVGTCNPSTGQCVALTINEGLACDADSNPCTVNDVCVAGSCVPGATLDCSYLNSSCQYGRCLASGTFSATCVPIITNKACDPDYCLDGCTVPHQWWSLHNSRCKDASKRFTWPDDLENQLMCGETYYFWSQKRAQTIWRALMHEWLAATLNHAKDACLPETVASIINAAEDLLRDCDFALATNAPEARLYKSYAIILKSYNSGILGPGECTQAPCAVPLYSGNYFDCLFQTRDVVERDEIDFFSAESCINGMWDYVSEFCQCFVGWAGLDCDVCASSVNEDEVFICVPVLNSDTFLLRSVPIESVPMYINEDREQILQIVRATGKKARYPGDGVLDCACQRIGFDEDDELFSRDLAVYIAQDDTIVYIDTIEQGLQLCEQIFDVTFINANPLCDDNIEVVLPDNETSNCNPPDDWNYICDCCMEDDDGCPCPQNDRLCLRNHLIREHQKVHLFYILFIIFMTITGVLFVVLSVIGIRWYVSRRKAVEKMKAENRQKSSPISSSIFSKSLKKRSQKMYK